MRMRPQLWLGSAVLHPVLALALAACGSSGASNDEPQASAASSEQSLPSPAERSLASNVIPTDELLWELGPQVRDRVRAVSSLADDARYSQVANKWPDSVTRLGTNPEEVLAIDPDLLFVASFSTPEYRAALEGKVGLVVLEGFNGFDDYRKNLDVIGDAVGAREATDALKVRFDTRLAAVEAKRPTKAPTCLSWSEGYVAGANTSFADIARAAGCRPIAAEKGLQGHQPLDLEQILAWDPDVFVIPCGGDCKRARDQLSQRPGLESLRAVREGQVVTIESAVLSSVGEGMLEFAAQLQAAL